MVLYSVIDSDPPLNEEDIPVGLWLCHTCRITRDLNKTNAKWRINSIENDLLQIDQMDKSRPGTPDVIAKIQMSHKRSTSRVSSCSELSNENTQEKYVKNHSNFTNSDVITIENGCNGVATTEKCENLNEKRASVDVNDTNQCEKETEIEQKTCAADETTSIEMSNKNDVEIETEIQSINGKTTEDIETENATDCVRSSLDALIKAATILNPKQFQLPRELNIFPRFPGDEKSERSK